MTFVFLVYRRYNWRNSFPIKTRSRKRKMSDFLQKIVGSSMAVTDRVLGAMFSNSTDRVLGAMFPKGRQARGGWPLFFPMFQSQRNFFEKRGNSFEKRVGNLSDIHCNYMTLYTWFILYLYFTSLYQLLLIHLIVFISVAVHIQIQQWKFIIVITVALAPHLSKLNL